MTGLREHADSGGPEVVLAADLAHQGPAAIANGRLLDADQITDEGEFPNHGKFLAVRREQPGNGSWADELEYWECPSALAAEITDELDEDETIAGTGFQVARAHGGNGDPWKFDVTVFDTDAPASDDPLPE